MAVPKRKTSKAVKRKRQTHDVLTAATSMECSNCGSTKRPHHVCRSCGYYDGKQVVASRKKTAA